MRIGAAILAGLLFLVGVRSFFRLSSVSLETHSVGEDLLYALHLTARISVWFALAGAFVGFAVLDEPERFRWYVLIPIGLAAIQVFAAIALWRSPVRRPPRAGGETSDPTDRPGPGSEAPPG